MNMTEERRYNLYIEQIMALEKDKDDVLREAKEDGFDTAAILVMVAFNRLSGIQQEELTEYTGLDFVLPVPEAAPGEPQPKLDYDL